MPTASIGKCKHCQSLPAAVLAGAPEAAMPDAGEAAAVAFKDRLVEVRTCRLKLKVGIDVVNFYGVEDS